jgi:general secretion pathway protein D
VGVLAGLLVALLALVVGPDLLPEAGAEEEPIEIVVTEKLDMETFLQIVGRMTEYPLYWDPNTRGLKQKEIIGATNLKAPKKEILSLVRALLTFYELMLVPVGPQGYQIYLVIDAKAQQNLLIRPKPVYLDLREENLEYLESQDGLWVATTIRVENLLNLRDARNALQRLVTNNLGHVQEVPAARAFVVNDFAPNVVAIYRLLKEMDVQPEGKEVTSAYVQLKHATADEIEPILTDIFTGQERVPRVQQGQQPPDDVEADPEPRIIADFRTNQLIIYATKDDILEIEDVISRLDVPVWTPNSWVHVLPLKNLDAQTTAEVLQALIEQSTFFGTGAGATGGGTGRPAGGRPPGSEVPAEDQEKPAVVADVASNSLLIAATPRQYEELKRIIAQIDVKKPQVLIEAALIELTLEDAYRWQVELGAADDAGLVSDDAVSGFGFTTFGLQEFADKDGDTFFTDRIPGFVNQGGAAPTGLVGGIFAAGQVPLIFNLLNSIETSRILQLPSIVTADNEEAVIRVLDRQATSQSTTSTGGNVTGGFQGFQDAGVTLQISPHIADHNYLLLNIRLVVSAFVGEPRVVGGALLPADQIERELITAVTVPNKHTVVLGGLLGQNQTSSIDRTPYMADIPVLGELFKSSARRDRNTSLFLFVTPTIMAEPGGFDVLDEVSCRRKQKADELIGRTEIFNSYFPACDLQDPATGCIRGSGSASDRLDRLGALEATRFAGVSPTRIRAEQAARRAVLNGEGCAPPPVATRR